MNFTKKEILFASIVGSQVAKSIPRFSLLQNELSKHALPPIPFLPPLSSNGQDSIADGVQRSYADNWKANQKLNESSQFHPISFRKSSDNQTYLFPYEPLITISGTNTIAKQKVAKAKNFVGTVKEHFSQDDWQITITGIFFGALERGNTQDCFPRSDFQKLADYFSKGEVINVFCEPLQLLGINQIVIDDITFPFTKGENVQAYEIKTCSDFTSELLLEILE